MARSRNPRLLALTTAVALAIGGFAVSSCAQPAPNHVAVAGDATLLTVSATAEVRRAPDIANLSTGVVTQAADANSAIRRNAEEMTRVVAAIRKAGIAERDIQTTGVNLNPEYRYAENQPPKITGYNASNDVSIKVRDVRRLGDILDALVAVGANQVNGPMFDIEDKDAVLDEARDKALAKARLRAEQYGKRLGLRVRRIVSIDETGGRAVPRPMFGGRAEMAMAADATAAKSPISPGENVLGITLDVVFELGK